MRPLWAAHRELLDHPKPGRSGAGWSCTPVLDVFDRFGDARDAVKLYRALTKVF